MTEKTWGGRFAEKTDRAVEQFTASIQFDYRLYSYDIAGSVAHCRMLAAVGILTGDEADTLVEGLERIRQELDRGNFDFDPGQEDIHMYIENRLVEQVGKVALKLHTARSRNDQVALDVRMYLRDATDATIGLLQRLRKVLVDLAEAHLTVVMPGYTHLQRAQPVLFSHHLMAYYEMFKRDSQRLADCRKRIDVMPLGTAALAGTTYPIDRAHTAELLGFANVSDNSIDAVSDRDFIVEFLAAASLCMTHLSRLSEEMMLWSSAEFSFVELPDAFATGSSIMPQKKNPDVPEIVRGKTGRVLGSLMGMLTLLKALPLSYNRDLQEDKPLLFDAVDTLQACLDIYARMLPNLRIRSDRMARATESGFLNATDFADYLVGKGLAFRSAHHCVGQAVAYALENGKELHELSLEELKRFSDLIEADVFDNLTTQAMIERRSSYGGTATDNVRRAVEAARKEIQA
ncbi:MAG TPA: argininosuccinate lyase [Desulfobacterales bacterium]